MEQLFLKLKADLNVHISGDGLCDAIQFPHLIFLVYSLFQGDLGTKNFMKYRRHDLKIYI